MKNTTVRIMDEFIDATTLYSWNTTRQYYTLIKVIKGLLNGDLMKQIRKESKTVGEPYMGEFHEAMEKLNKKFNIDKNSEIILSALENAMFPRGANNYKDVLTNDILYSNYKLLKDNGLLADYLRHFHSYFSGEMVAIHRIPYSDLIVFEFKQKPFSNERQYHWDEPDEKKFYSNKNVSRVYNTFDECLIASKFPTYYRSVLTLLEKEQEDLKE